MNYSTEDLESCVQVHLWIQGRVQGVGYRASTYHKARQLNLKGWVRNLPDGQVEAVFEGPQPQIETMMSWCREGPPAAIVTDLRVEYETCSNLEDFQITRSLI